MRILLLAMPGSAEIFDGVAKIPNLGLVSLAGNLEGHDVRVLDLVLRRGRVRESVVAAVRELRPELVGLSAMTFQFASLLDAARLVREIAPGVPIAAGGYHPTLMAEELAGGGPLPIDYLVRGEGEATFAELVACLAAGGGGLERVAGLSRRTASGWVHAPARALLATAQIRLPRRDARVDDGFHFLGLPADAAETSRGCPFDCSFCSITHMYGRTFRTFPVGRVLDDLRAIRARGRRVVFFVDDNITAAPKHFAAICEAIAREGLDDLTYIVQLSARGLAQNPELAGLMRRANFRYAFVGFESMLPESLQSVGKPTDPEINRRAARLLRENGLAIIAGCIVGYPADDRRSVLANLKGIRRLRPDAFYAQYLTPYPKTKIREELLAEGLVENAEDFSRYDGFTCNVRTRRLTQPELVRAMRQGLLRSALSLRMIAGNYFLRHHLRACLRSTRAFAVASLRELATGTSRPDDPERPGRRER